MKKRFLALLFVVGISAFAMAHAETIVKQVKISSTARGLNVDPTFYAHPLVADVVVDTKTGRIRDTWHLTAQELLSRMDTKDDNATLANLRAYAMFKSSEQHNCDMIVSPTFDVKFGSDGADITIVGYCANFTNFQVATNEDLIWITNTKYSKGETIQGVQKVR